MGIRQFTAFVILLSLGALALLLIAAPAAPSTGSRQLHGTTQPTGLMAPEATAIKLSPAQNGTTTVSSAPAPPSIQSSTSNSWQIECADCPKLFSNLTGRSLRLDASGQPHIAYAGDHVYYAWYDGTTWHYETVNQSIGAHWYPSLALNALGQPHISYFDATTDQLKRAWRDATRWHSELVDSTVQARETALELDSVGNLHIAYCDDTDQYLKLARQDGGVWHIETVDNSSASCGGVSFALDDKDRPHISYCADYTLKLAWFDGAAWRIDTVDTANYSRTSLALEPETGRPHISYRKVSQIRHAWHDGTAWQTETVEQWAGSLGRSTALALDPGTGQPHIAYDSGPIDAILTLTYAWHDGTGWQTEWVSETGLSGSEISMAVDITGRTHIGFLRFGNAQSATGHLSHARLDAGVWQIEEVDSSALVGWNTSLALDSEGQPHISYTDRVENVKYAFVPSPTPPVPHAYPQSLPHGQGESDATIGVANLQGARTWLIETVDRLGVHPSLALDKKNQPHISFGAYGRQAHFQRAGAPLYPLAPATATPIPMRDLELAWREGEDWRLEPVDIPGNTGYHTSVALDSSQRPHISYYDTTNDDLRFASYDGVGWRTATVDASGDVGTYSSLALDKKNRPHISYYDATNGDLKYAFHDGVMWSLETVDGAGETGRYSSIALDATGQPHISYYDSTLDDLKYAYLLSPTVGIQRDSSRWTIETVDIVGGVDTSLALDPGNDLPRISYQSDGNLNYAWYDGLKWRIETVDAGPNIGRYSSLALNADTSLPSISYQAGNPWYDLRYARRASHPFSLDKEAEPSDHLHAGDTLTYTLTVIGPGVRAHLFDPLPANVDYVSGTLTSTLRPAPIFSPTAKALFWRGTLPTNVAQQIQFQVTLAVTAPGSLSLAPPIANTAWLTDTTNRKTVSATVIVNALHVCLPLVNRNR